MGRQRAGVKKLQPIIVHLTLVTSNRSVSKSQRLTRSLCLFCNDNMVLDERWDGTHRKQGEMRYVLRRWMWVDGMDSTLPVQVRLHLTIYSKLLHFTTLSFKRATSLSQTQCKNELYLSQPTRIPPHSPKLWWKGEWNIQKRFLTSCQQALMGK